MKSWSSTRVFTNCSFFFATYFSFYVTDEKSLSWMYKGFWDNSPLYSTPPPSPAHTTTAQTIVHYTCYRLGPLEPWLLSIRTHRYMRPFLFFIYFFFFFFFFFGGGGGGDNVLAHIIYPCPIWFVSYQPHKPCTCARGEAKEGVLKNLHAY